MTGLELNRKMANVRAKNVDTHRRIAGLKGEIDSRYDYKNLSIAVQRKLQ